MKTEYRYTSRAGEGAILGATLAPNNHGESIKTGGKLLKTQVAGALSAGYEPEGRPLLFSS
jgi:hypothetical protein